MISRIDFKSIIIKFTLLILVSILIIQKIKHLSIERDFETLKAIGITRVQKRQLLLAEAVISNGPPILLGLSIGAVLSACLKV